MSIDGSASGSTDAESFIDMVLALVPDAAVIVDEQGLIVSFNENLGRLFGYDADELVGQPVEILVPERFRHWHRGQRSGFLADPRIRAMGAGLDLYGRRKDGSELAVDISLAPISTVDRGLVVAAVRDVSERRATEAAHAQLAAIVRSSMDAILATTVEGHISSWNPGAEHTLGYTGEEIIGQHVSKLVPGDRSILFEEQLDAARRNEPLPPADTEWLTRSGDRLPVAVTLSPMVDSGGRLAGFSVLLRDITEQTRTEAELRRLLRVSERHARFQQVSAEVREAVLTGDPLERVFQLVAEGTAELVGATAVLVLRDADRVVAASGTATPLLGTSVPMPRVADRRKVSVLAGDELDAPLGPLFGGRLVLVAVIGGTSDDDVALVCDTGEAADELEAEQILISFADQAVLAIELERARRDRERVLLADERERIARDLHDHAVQSLFATGLGLQAVMPLVDNERVAERMNEAVESLDATIRQIRTAIFTLSAPPRSGSTLRADVVRLAAEAARGLGFEPAVSFDGPVDIGVPASLAAELVAVEREALSNVARHAHARRVSVELTVSVDECRLCITDDGCGFTGAPIGSGLRNLTTRAELLGGTLEVTSGSGQGTRLDWRVPLT